MGRTVSLSAGVHLAATAKFSVIEAGRPPAGASVAPARAASAAGGGGGAVAVAVGGGGGGSADVDAKSAAVVKQGSAVKELKKAGAPQKQIDAAVEVLGQLKAELEAARKSEGDAAPSLDRAAFDDTLIKKMFVVPSFEIHNGVAGLFDLGPPGCALKANLLDTWRRHFVLAENMLEMECTNLTPEVVLRTSGHVDKFTDLMVKDVETGECYRADKILEDHIDKIIDENPTMPSAEQDKHRLVQRQADAYTPTEIDALLAEYGIKAAATGNALTPSFPFNLMFKTMIGPTGQLVGYLRPETAQGLFVNFRRLLDFNQGKMPFAAAQIGLGFRNEIAPRNGLLRVREFCMAEIEHFVNPNDKTTPRFASVADKVLSLFSQDAQLGTGRPFPMAIGEAVAQGLVNNETLGFFLARTQLFMEKIGLDPARLRFRQHLKTEMAHYAADCWDLEIHTSYGW